MNVNYFSIKLEEKNKHVGVAISLWKPVTRQVLQRWGKENNQEAFVRSTEEPESYPQFQFKVIRGGKIKSHHMCGVQEEAGTPIHRCSKSSELMLPLHPFPEHSLQDKGCCCHGQLVLFSRPQSHTLYTERMTGSWKWLLGTRKRENPW